MEKTTINLHTTATTNSTTFDVTRRRFWTVAAAVGLIGGFMLLGCSLLITTAEHFEHRSFHLDWIYVLVFLLLAAGAESLDRAGGRSRGICR